MLDYFGESPYIVRSSSLLEDTYGNAFAGKYDSVFCVNRGPREQRLQALLDCVRQVYASTMSEKALQYRVHRGLLDQDEQMALLVMRVSGSQCGDKFFPHLAGVGLLLQPLRLAQGHRSPGRSHPPGASAWARGRSTGPTTTTRGWSR